MSLPACCQTAPVMVIWPVHTSPYAHACTGLYTLALVAVVWRMECFDLQYDPLHYAYHTTLTALRLLHYPYCTTPTALPLLHYAYCTALRHLLTRHLQRYPCRTDHKSDPHYPDAPPYTTQRKAAIPAAFTNRSRHVVRRLLRFASRFQQCM